MSYNYIMHFGIKGMKWRKRKSLKEQAESQARIAEGRRRAYDEANYAKKKAADKRDWEAGNYTRSSHAYDKANAEYKKAASNVKSETSARVTDKKRREASEAQKAKDNTKRRLDKSTSDYETAKKNASYTYKKAFDQPQPDRSALVKYRDKVRKKVDRYNSKGAKKIRKLFGKKSSGKLVSEKAANYDRSTNVRKEYISNKWVPKKKR